MNLLTKNSSPLVVAERETSLEIVLLLANLVNAPTRRTSTDWQGLSTRLPIHTDLLLGVLLLLRRNLNVTLIV